MSKPTNISKERERELLDRIHMIDEIIPADYDVQTPPAVTIYMPMHHDQREGRRDEWDRIEFKDLVKQAVKTLEEEYGKRESRSIIEMLEYVRDHGDLPLWLTAGQGLAFLVDLDDCYVYSMHETPDPSVHVGSQFNLKPLLDEEQRDVATRYKLLLLNADFFGILDGNDEYVVFEDFPDDVVHYFAETYPEFDGEISPLDYYSLEDHMSPYHGWKSRNDVKKEEKEKFFRYVNKVMNDELVRDEDEVPVILVTLPEHVHMFREICTFKSLYPKAIEKDPRDLTGDQLRHDALKILGD